MSLKIPLMVQQFLHNDKYFLTQMPTKKRKFSMAETQQLIEFRSGYACGESFIPRSANCYKGKPKSKPGTFKDYAKERARVYKAAQRGQMPQNENERKLLTSVQRQQGKIQGNKERAVLEALKTEIKEGTLKAISSPRQLT